MRICKCEKIEWLETVFGLIVFMGILFMMKDKVILLFEQMAWYRALAVTLGAITLIGSIAIVSSFAVEWFTEHIVFVTITASILWIVGYAVL